MMIRNLFVLVIFSVSYASYEYSLWYLTYRFLGVYFYIRQILVYLSTPITVKLALWQVVEQKTLYRKYISFFVTDNGTSNCQCGMNIRSELVDVGYAWNWPLFPIVALRLGDTGKSFESIHFRVGPLVCEQGMSRKSINVMFSSAVWKRSWNELCIGTLYYLLQIVLVISLYIDIVLTILMNDIEIRYW